MRGEDGKVDVNGRHITKPENKEISTSKKRGGTSYFGRLFSGSLSTKESDHPNEEKRRRGQQKGGGGIRVPIKESLGRVEKGVLWQRAKGKGKTTELIKKPHTWYESESIWQEEGGKKLVPHCGLQTQSLKRELKKASTCRKLCGKGRTQISRKRNVAGARLTNAVQQENKV